MNNEWWMIKEEKPMAFHITTSIIHYSPLIKRGVATLLFVQHVCRDFMVGNKLDREMTFWYNKRN